MDAPAERVAAVEGGRAAAQDFDALDGGARDAAPINPPAERVVERNAVEEDDGATRPACADAAQRDSLRSGVRRAAARAPEEGEAGNLAEGVVERCRRRGRQVR